MYTLGDLKVGQIALIESINASNAYTEELRSLGFCEGCTVKCIRRSIFGRLLHVKCNNTTVVLRQKESRVLSVTLAE